MDGVDLVTSKGVDWVYTQLVKVALHGNEKRIVREHALKFRRDVLDAIVGIAACDIDWHSTKDYRQVAYRMVFDVCKELSDEVR